MANPVSPTALPIIYDASTPVFRPIFDRAVRAGLVMGIEWASLSLVEDMPGYLRVITLVIAVLILAVLESRYFLKMKGRWYFPALMGLLIATYIATLAFAFLRFSSSSHSDGTAIKSPAHVASQPMPPRTMSEDEKQFRKDLKIFIRSTLATNISAFDQLFGLTSMNQGVNYSKDPETVEAAARLTQNALHCGFEPIWQALYTDTDKSTEALDVRKIMSDFKVFMLAYDAAQLDLRYFLDLAGADPNKGDLLRKWLDADKQAKTFLGNLLASSVATDDGLQRYSFASDTDRFQKYLSGRNVGH